MYSTTNAILAGLGMVALIALMLAGLSNTGSLEACMGYGVNSEDVCRYALR